MGVKLQELIVRDKIDFSQLAGKIIAVDAPNIIFSLINFSYKNAQYSFSNLMTDNTQRAISHLYGILYRVNFYYSKKIFPVFCFDGKDSELKRVITKDQLNDFRVTQKRYDAALRARDRSLARQIALSKEFLWPNIVKESKLLLNALGVPFVESPASAESQCAQLVKEGVADLSNSQDLDSLLFGCPRVVQNLSKSLRRKVQGKWTYNKVVLLLIDLEKNLKSLELNQYQLVDLALLVGTDYFSGIQGIGPKTALKLIKKHEGLKKVMAKERSKYDFTSLIPEIVKSVRKIFLMPEVLNFGVEFCWNYPNASRVFSLLCEDHHLNKGRVENNLEKFSKNFEKCKDFFNYSKKLTRARSFQKTLDATF